MPQILIRIEESEAKQIQEKAKEYHEKLVEKIAESDDTLLNKYLEGEEISDPSDKWDVSLRRRRKNINKKNANITNFLTTFIK